MKKIISKLLEKGFLVSPDFLSNFNFDNDFNTFSSLKDKKDKPLVLNKDLLVLIKSGEMNFDINWNEFEKSKALMEKGKDGKIYKTFLDILSYNISPDKREKLDKIMKQVEKPEKVVVVEKEEKISNIVVLKSYKDEIKKVGFNDFVQHFRLRYDALKTILEKRAELQNVISINRALAKKNREPVALIGMIKEKRRTKNNNIIIALEDITGEINVVISKTRQDVFEVAKDLVLDEVIGVLGVTGDKIVFANDLVLPDVPSTKELKKNDEEVYVVFTADMHVGSNVFYKDDFVKFVEWINGETGSSKQREVAKKVKYLFIVGDLVDGVGIFPDQDKELVIKDVTKQYEYCASLLSKIRKDIHIIICGGNHDALRISEPQPILNKKYAKSIYDLPNVIMVTNPSLVNIHSSKDFPGFDVLLYHGYSFHYYADNVESIRNQGGHERADLIMKFLLQRRHLAPTHASSLYIPDTREDPLVIDKVPDFFVTAHIHRTSASMYKNINLIGCGCWVGQTPFQEKVGIHPDPSRVSLVNLKTREVKILRFGK